MALKLDCRKFAPNIFNKTKCQNCFRPKDAHSAAALESNRLSRKVCKCGYLFVAPDLDFSNPVNKTKRWQRRWFVLYDDGEFTFCVDDHPETVPQCIIDMNQCQDVSEAEEVTGHQFSISLSIPDKIYYIKANSQEEINWWFDALHIYPRSLINKNWKTTLAPATQKQEEEQNKQEGKLDVSEIAKIPQDLKKTCVKTEAINSRTASLDLSVELPKLISVEQSEDIPLFPQEIINCQDVVSTSGTFLNETDESSVSDNLHKNTGVMQSSMNSNNISNSNYMSSNSVKSIFNKSSDPSETVDDTLTRSRYRGKRAGILYRRSKSDGVARMFPTDITSSDSKPKYLYEVLSTPDPPKAKLKNPVYLLLSDAPIAKHIETFEKLQDKHPKKSDITDTIKKGAGLTAKLIDGFERRNSVSRITPRMVRSGRGINGSDLPARRSRSLTRDPGQYQDSSHGSSGMAEYQYYSSRSATHSPERWDLTDSLKSRSPEKLQKEEKNIEYLKKGWLLKKDGTQELWAKHWFVLSSTTLMYYSEPQAETEGRPDGGIDLNTIQKVQEIDVSRNYGFEISTNDGLPLVLSATTLGIRSHWIEALETALKDPVDKSLNSVIDVKTLTEKLQPELQRERKRETAKCRPRRLDLEKVIMSDNLQQDSTNKSSPNADAHSGVEEIAVKFSDAVDSQEDELLQNENNEINGLLKQPSSPPPSKTPISLIKERSKMRSPFKIKNSHDSSHSADEKSSTVTCVQNQKSQLITEEENEKPVILHISEKNEKELNLISELSENDLSFDKKNDNKAASENMVVELLETEVESLKAQLEHTQSEMAKTYDANTELKAKLKALRRDHYDSFTELENEHSKYLLQNCKHSDDEPQELSGENQTDVQLKNRIKELEEQLNSFQSLHIDQIQSLKAAYELEISKSSDYSIDHDAIRQKYVAEINMLKAFFEKNIQTTEQSHRHIIEELKTQHHNDIEQMRIEKEQALAEETKATISALEAMRKAHQSEMERELTRLKEISVNQASKLDLSGSYNDEVLESVREEIQQLSEKYSLKCMEIAALEELVEIQKKSLDKLRKRIVDLITKNEELVTQVASKTLMTDAEKENLSEKIKVVQELQEMLRDKENEVIMLKRTVLELQQEIHFLKIDRNKESSSSSIDVSFVNSSPVVTKPPLPSSLGTILKQRASIVKELHPPECNSPSEEVDASSSSSEIKQTKIPIAVKEKETRKANGNNSSLKDRSRSPGRKVDSQRSKKSFQDRTSESLTRL